MARRRPSGRTLLVISSIPAREDAMAIVASICGLATPDVSLRLTGILPRVLLSGDAARMGALSATLAQHGFSTLVCDPADAPEDGNRILARTLELEPDGFVAVERSGARHPVPGASIVLLQRGFRVSVTRETVPSSERRLSLGRAALTGGLLLSRKVKQTTEEESESREAFLLVHRERGAQVMLYEQRLDYRFLGSELQRVALGNLALTTTRIRTLVPHVPLDERAVQQRFVQALRPTSFGDPLDLALHLVALTYQP